MALPHHHHECEECGAGSIYHRHRHEEEGDTVTAYCDNCGEDTPHTVGGFFA